MIKNIKKIAVFVLAVLMMLALIPNSPAIYATFTLTQLVDDSDYIIMGKVVERRDLSKEAIDSQGKPINIKFEGGEYQAVYQIEVKEVLFAKDPSWEKRKTIFIYNPGKYVLDEALPLVNKTYLYFLKKHSFDSSFAEFYNLKEDTYFAIGMGRQGQIDISNTKAIKEIRKILSQREESSQKGTTIDPIDNLIATLAKQPLWQNGAYPIILLPQSATSPEVIDQCIKMVGFDQGHIKTYKIIEIREIDIPNSYPPHHCAALIDSDLGGKIVLFRYENPKIGWWSRVFDVK